MPKDLNILIRLVSEVIQVNSLIDYVSSSASGAVVVFHGTVRDHHEGSTVLSLEYQAYEPMALRMLEQLAAEAKSRWNVNSIAIVHRLGAVPIGDTAVVIAVAAHHRQEAFAACSHLIDRLKDVVPIWKKEITEEGSRWIGESRLFDDADDRSSQPR